MISRRILHAITLLIFVLTVGMPLFYRTQSVYPYTTTKTFFFQIVVEIIFFLWIALAAFDRRYRLTMTPLLWSICAFLAVLLGTALLGADPWRSFWSTQERVLGIFALLHFAALAVVLSSVGRNVPWRALFGTSLATAVVTVAIAFIQFGYPNILLQEFSGGAVPANYRPGSTFGNPTFLAGYLLFHVFLGLSLFADAYAARSAGAESALRGGERKKARARTFLLFFSAASTALVIAGLFATQTRGDILGLGLGVFVLIALFAVRPPEEMPGILGKRSLYRALVLSLLLFGLLFVTTRANPVWERVPGIRRFRDISLESKGLAPRLQALRAAWNGFLEKPFTGWGWDNYNIVFNKYYDPELLEINYLETRFDKVHNMYLEYLATGGIPLFLAYLTLVACALIALWRTRRRLFSVVFTAGIVAYLGRSIFVFDTLGPLLMFYLVLGCIDTSYREARSKNALKNRFAEPDAPHSRRMAWAVAAGSAAAAILVVYTVNVQSLRAVYHQYWGFNYFVLDRPARAIQNFKDAIGIWSPYRWALKRDYAAAVSENYFYRPESVPPEEVVRAIRAMEETAREHPLDAYNHYALLDMLNQTSDVNPEEWLARAEEEAQVSLELSPNRQQVLFSLAKTKFLKGEKENGIEILERALALNPNVADAHFYYGLLLSDIGKRERGYRALQKALALGRRWRVYHEPRVVANYFADAGHVDEAVPLYEKALEMEPGDAEAKAKLGLAYFFLEKRDLARKYLSEVAAEFDLTKSPSYATLKPILDALGIPSLSPRGGE